MMLKIHPDIVKPTENLYGQRHGLSMIQKALKKGSKEELKGSATRSRKRLKKLLRMPSGQPRKLLRRS